MISWCYAKVKQPPSGSRRAITWETPLELREQALISAPEMRDDRLVLVILGSPTTVIESPTSDGTEEKAEDVEP